MPSSSEESEENSPNELFESLINAIKAENVKNVKKLLENKILQDNLYQSRYLDFRTKIALIESLNVYKRDIYNALYDAIAKQYKIKNNKEMKHSYLFGKLGPWYHEGKLRYLERIKNDKENLNKWVFETWELYDKEGIDIPYDIMELIVNEVVGKDNTVLTKSDIDEALEMANKRLERTESSETPKRNSKKGATKKRRK